MDENGIYEILPTAIAHKQLRITADPENQNLGLDIVSENHNGTSWNYNELDRGQVAQLRNLLNQFLGE